MSQHSSEPVENSTPNPDSGAKLVPTSPAEVAPSPTGQDEASSPAEATPQAVRLDDYAARVAAQTGHLGFNPETVIIQPPPPPPEPPTGRIEENAVTKTQLAEQLNVSVRTVERWANEGVLPAPLRQGRGGMETLFQHDAALVYWGEQTEQARKERRARQRNRRNLPQDGLTRESRSRRGRRPGSSS